MSGDLEYLIGLTGLNASGKGTAAELLKKRGFSYYSLSDMVRQYAAEKGMDHTRESLIYCGNELRKDFGPGVLAERTLEKISSEHPRRAVVDSIRNIYEIGSLRKNKGFKLIAIDAPAAIRFERSKKRGRIGFETSLEDFIKVEKKENSLDPQKQQLFKCLELADFVIDNSGDISSLEREIENILNKIAPTCQK